MASLGTLTLDLVARTAGFVQGMSKAERASNKWRRQVKKDVEQVGRVSGVAFAVASAAAVKLTTDLVSSAREVQRFAQIANTSTTEFQQYANAADQVGISQEKFADILKDVNDKVGDFLVTGGGPLKDFFETVAPQIGVTADQFRNLSGPQALQLYVSSLEKANASQEELTFFLEAIASDATALLPLLKNNGEAFRTLAENSAFIDEETIEQSNRLAAALFILDSDLTKIKNSLVDDVIPVLVTLSGAFVASSGDAQDATEDFNALGKSLATVTAVGAGAAGFFELAGKAIAGTAAVTVGAFTKSREEFNALQREFISDLDATALKYGDFINRLFASANSDGNQGASSVEDRIKKVQEALAAIGSSSGSTGGGVSGAADALEKISVSSEKIPDAMKEARDKLEAYFGVVRDLRTEDEVINDTLRERLALIEAAGVADSETRARAVNAAFGGRAPDFGGLDAAVGGPASELQRLNRVEDEVEQYYARELERLAEFRDQRLILQSEYDDQEAQLVREREEEIRQIEQARQTASLVAAETLFGNLADVTKNFAGEQSAAYQVLFAIEKGAAIARSIIAIQAAIAQASASGPFPANLAAMASVASATAGLVSTISSTSIQGQAHDGLMSVPRTGTYILERGERVTTAETSAKMDGLIDEARSGGGSTVVAALGDAEIEKWLGGKSGEKIVLAHIRRNQSTVRSLARV